MKIQPYFKWSLPLALASAIATPAHANNCNDLSELLLTLGDEYANLEYSHGDNAPVEPSTQRLFDSIKKKDFRSGKGIRVNCLGKNSHRKEARTQFYLSDVEMVDTARGNIQLTAWEESSRKALSSVMDLPPAKLWTKQSSNSYKTKQLFRRTNRRLGDLDASFSQNYLYGLGVDAQTALNQPTQSIASLAQEQSELLDFPNRVGSYITEIETLVEQTAGGITVMQTFYVNGYKSEWVTWQLDS